MDFNRKTFSPLLMKASPGLAGHIKAHRRQHQVGQAGHVSFNGHGVALPLA